MISSLFYIFTHRNQDLRSEQQKEKRKNFTPFITFPSFRIRHDNSIETANARLPREYRRLRFTKHNFIHFLARRSPSPSFSFHLIPDRTRPFISSKRANLINLFFFSLETKFRIRDKRVIVVSEHVTIRGPVSWTRHRAS